MDAPAASVAEATARYLRGAGVRRVYGVPGEDHLRLLDALEQTNVQYVAARDETAAAIMAAAEAQATGIVGVVVVTLAPGLTNAINGIASAWLDHVPLLVIAGQHGPERYPIIVRQGLDNHALVASITKWRATTGSRIHQVLARALDTALAPPAGPVFLELRDDVARATPSDAPEPWPLLACPRPYAEAPPERLQPFADALQHAERPVIIAGARTLSGDSDLGCALADLAQAAHAPVFTSPAAKGLLTFEHAWFAGAFLNGNPEAAILDRCDLVLAVGLDAMDFFNAPWRYAATVLGLEPDAANTQRFVPMQTQVIGNLSSSLRRLRGDSRSAWTTDDVRAYRTQLSDTFGVDADALTIPTAMAEARAVFPPHTLLSVDAGFGKPLASYLWPACEPNTCFTAQGLSTMGYAIPAANALQLAFPERPVLALMGDGSLLMRASEISVAAEQAIAPVYVAWVDATLSQIEIKQRRQGLRPVGATFPAPDCAAIAAAFGGVGWDVQTRSELRAALEQARSAGRPALIGARVDQRARDAWFDLLRG